MTSDSQWNQKNPCNTSCVRFQIEYFGKRFKGLGARVRSISRLTDDDVGWDERKLLDVAKLCHDAIISCHGYVSPKTNWKHRRGIQISIVLKHKIVLLKKLLMFVLISWRARMTVKIILTE